MQQELITTGRAQPVFLVDPTSKTAYGVAPAAAPVDRSGAITTGGTAQALMAANAQRVGFWVQNQSAGDLYINELGAATLLPPSIKIAAGAYYESSARGTPSSAISIVGATTAQAFSAREW